MLWTKKQKPEPSEEDLPMPEEDSWIDTFKESIQAIKDHTESISSSYRLGLISEEQYYEENSLLMFRLDQLESEIRKHQREQLHREKKNTE